MRSLPPLRAKRQRYSRKPISQERSGPVYFGGQPTISTLLAGLVGSTIPPHERRQAVLEALRAANYACEVCGAPDTPERHPTARQLPSGAVQVVCGDCTHDC